MDYSFITNGFKDARDMLLETLRMFPRSKEHEPVVEEWSTHDLIALHIGWETHYAEVVEAVMEENQIESIEDTNTFDQKVVMEHQSTSWNELMEQFEESSSHLLMSMDFFDESQWSAQPYIDSPKTMQDIMMDIIAYYKKHTQVISQLI
jgi:hypothetical protein